MKTLAQIAEAGWPLQERAGTLYAPTHDTAEHIDAIKAELLSLEWLTKRTARHEYFMSYVPRNYSYGKGTGLEQYSSRDFSPLVQQAMEKLNEELGTKFNVCFLNKYDDQHQHLGWHADDFPTMDPSEPIGVISYGAEREIWVKNQKGFEGADGWLKTPPDNKQPEDQRILLQDGSLFIMPPGYQDTHFHRIPKHHRPCGWRISLTFRTFIP